MSFIDTSSGTPTYQVSPPPMNNRNVFNGFGSTKNYGKDMGGTETAMFNYWMQQQQNAYELELWNLNNQYNSPSAQMARFQQAGLNPNLIYSQQNSSGGPAGSSAPIAAKPTNFRAQNTLGALDSAARIVQGINSVLDQVQQTYDYAKYGFRRSELQNTLMFHNIANTQEQGEALRMSNFIQKILSGEYGLDQEFYRPIDGTSYTARDVPAIQRYLNSNEKTAIEIERIDKYLREMFPLEKANLREGAALRQSERQWNENIRGFVNSINTGVPWLDSLLRAAMRIVVGRVGGN